MKEDYLTIGAQLKAKGQNIIKKQDLPKREPKKDFFGYVKDGNRKKINELISNGTNVNAKDEDGWTALMLATDNNDIRTVEVLLELGADVNVKNDEGQTALMLAALINEEIIGNILILHGADIYLTDNWNQNAIDIAKETWEEKKKDYFLSNKQLEKIEKNKLCYFFCNVLINEKVGTSLSKEYLNNHYKGLYNKELSEEDIDFGIEFINTQIMGKNFQLKRDNENILIVSITCKEETFHLEGNNSAFPKWTVDYAWDAKSMQEEDAEVLLRMGEYNYEKGNYNKAELFLEQAAKKKNQKAKELLDKLYKHELRDKYNTLGPIPTNACRMTSGGNAPSGTWSKYGSYK